MPVWGYADVIASEAEGVPEGTRVYGYFPSASHLVVSPIAPSETDFVDATPHRQELPAAYNRYLRDRRQRDVRGGERGLRDPALAPLLHLVPDRRLPRRRGDVRRRRRRSSRAPRAAPPRRSPTCSTGATGSRWSVSRHRGTSSSPSRSASTTRSFRTRRSTRSTASPPSTSTCRATPRSGAPSTATSGTSCKHSAAVGITHREDLGGGSDLAGPRPVFFFAPDRLKKRTEDWGPEGSTSGSPNPGVPYVDWARRLAPGRARLRARGHRAHLPRDARRQVRPAVGHVLSPGD